jgi:hypothetical protein
MNAMGRLLPNGAWHSSAVLSTMSTVAGPLLGVERIGLRGAVPNGQRFIANPQTMWTIVDSRARLGGEDLGPPGAVHPQARLGDFWIPQRGILAIGEGALRALRPRASVVADVPHDLSCAFVAARERGARLGTIP